MTKVSLHTKSPGLQKILTLSAGKLGCTLSQQANARRLDFTYDLTAVLLVLGVAVGHHSSDATLHILWQIFD